MAAKTGSMVRGRTIRVTRLDGCGRIVQGDGNQAVSEGVVTAEFSANTSEADEINVTNFSGKRCVYEPSVESLAGYGLSIEFCKVDFEMFELLTGQELVFDANGDVVGIEMDTQIDISGSGFSFELWTGNAGTSGCEDPNAQGQWGYLLLPYLMGGMVGDFTVENDAVTFTISGASTRDGNAWGAGPYGVELGAGGEAALLSQSVSSTAALRMQFVNIAPPKAYTGSRPVLDPALPELTDITATPTGMDVDFTVTPTATGAVWWDFGDNEWDYVTAPGAASHTYDSAGTYTVLASQNGITWATKQVTV